MPAPREPRAEPQQASPALALIPTSRLHHAPWRRETIPAAVRREVWERDQGRCTWPLDSGGCCGSMHRLELDHIIPWARFGEPKTDKLRVVYATLNRLAARQAFGPRWMARYDSSRAGVGVG